MINIKPKSKLYLVGIGGISMSGLAELAKSYSFDVAGSEMHLSHRTECLEEIGIPVYLQDKEHISEFKPDLVIRTAAVPLSHPEILMANKLNIQVIERGEFLGWFTQQYNRVINVSGTHGKTTTTAMISQILRQERLHPTIHLGAELDIFDYKSVHVSSKQLFVSEACEYSNSFLHATSTTACILNVDLDHLDFFKDIDSITDVFIEFTKKIKKNGYLVIPHSGNQIDKLIQSTQDLDINVVTFSDSDKDADVYADNIVFHDGYPTFDVVINQEKFCTISLPIPGHHNILNALAAIACSKIEGVSKRSCEIALNLFHGADGRFSIRGRFQGALVVADYAHHPASTVATIRATQQFPHSNIWVVYQPLTYNRVKTFFNDYVNALKDMDYTLFYEIYSDRETDTLGMSSKLLSEAINEQGGSSEFFESYQDIKNKLAQITKADDIILFLGPEQVRNFAQDLVNEPASQRIQKQV